MMGRENGLAAYFTYTWGTQQHTAGIQSLRLSSLKNIGTKNVVV